MKFIDYQRIRHETICFAGGQSFNDFVHNSVQILRGPLFEFKMDALLINVIWQAGNLYFRRGLLGFFDQLPL
jgi:hypothetical protein